jgi:hypothetical protein
MTFLSYLRQSLTISCFRPKCDEQKPRCQKCIIRDAVCTYPPSTPVIWVGKKATDNGETCRNCSEPSPPAYSSSAPKEKDSITNNESLNLENINLIIHWFTTTVHTVNSTSNTAALEVCQTVVLKEAMQHHFLLHGLLALSALHLAESHTDSQKYTRIATDYHTQGLALYHSILSDINESNYSASIAFSSITTMFAFGIYKPKAPKTFGIELVQDLAQIFLLAKGWHNVVRVADALECRAGSAVFPSHNPIIGTLSTDMEAAFGRLHALNQGHDTALYTLAIDSLKSVFGTLANGRSDDPHLALEWVNTMPDDFVRLITQRQSLAMVILGYYCVVLDRVPQVWWLRGWSKGVFSVIWKDIHHPYQDTLEWPKKMIGFEG